MNLWVGNVEAVEDRQALDGEWGGRCFGLDEEVRVIATGLTGKVVARSEPIVGVSYMLDSAPGWFFAPLELEAA